MPAGMPPMPAGMVPAGMAGGLPHGWQLAVDAMGRPFYYNYFTQQTSWTPPSGTNNVPPVAPSSMYSVPAPPASIPAAPPVSAPPPAAPPPSTVPVDSMIIFYSYLMSTWSLGCFIDASFIPRCSAPRLGGSY